MEFWKTKHFKDLSAEWNEKLKESGLIDCESDGGLALKQRSTNAYRQATFLERETRLCYYTRLGHYAQNQEFEDQREALILLRHSDGALISEICSELEAKNQSLDRRTVRFIIRRWQMKWGLRRWNSRQLNLKRKISGL